jgi:hypothetical protein
VQARLAQLLHHRTVESLLQDGINSLFWMAQHRLSLNGCALEEIRLSSVIGQICPVSLHPDFNLLLYWTSIYYGPFLFFFIGVLWLGVGIAQKYHLFFDYYDWRGPGRTALTRTDRCMHYCRFDRVVPRLIYPHKYLSSI